MNVRWLQLVRRVHLIRPNHEKGEDHKERFPTSGKDRTILAPLCSSFCRSRRTGVLPKQPTFLYWAQVYTILKEKKIYNFAEAIHMFDNI